MVTPTFYQLQTDGIDFDDGFEQEERENGTNSFEENIRKQLLEFRSGSQREIIMEPMPLEKRKIVHHIASNCSLKSHSIGSRGNRRVVVTRFPRVDLSVYTNAKDSESVILNAFQKRALSQFLTTFPLGHGDIDIYLRSGIATRRVNGRWTANFNRPMLVPPRISERSAMQYFRRSLPTYSMKKEILKAIRTHKVTMIIGGTGCGKTTQVPQFILEDAAEREQKVRIFCTQPRRLPVLAVSARVAKERNEKLGATVGYHIRLEQKTSEQTVLTYCTSGVLLRLLTSDANAASISHIILDEIHEREQKTDYLLIALRQALKTRNDLRIILMSATMEDSRELFKRYFGAVNVFSLEVPSNLHEVKIFHLPEILAMTDYKHSSSFTGGTFFGKTARSLNDNNMDQICDSFPPVGEFCSENHGSSKYHSRRNGKKKGRNEMNCHNNEGISSRRFPTPADASNNFSSSSVGYFDSRQFRSQVSESFYQGNGQFSNHTGQANLVDMYSKMNISSDKINNRSQEQNYDGYQICHSQSALALNYSQPPPNWSYNQHMQMTPYGAGPYPGQQMMYATYPVMASQEDPQSSFPPISSTQDYMHPPKFYLPSNNVNGYSNQWGSSSSTYSNQSSSVVFMSSNIESGQNSVQNRDRGYYVSSLPNRPPYFDPSYVEVVQNTNLDTMYLVDSYMISGGEQWSESVDTDLTVAVIKYCMDSCIEGSILVFLPGYEDILAVREKVNHMKGCSTKPEIFTLHSQMSSQDQQRVFEPVAFGCRKVILSTNIAEASLTIDDVVFVIDCGKVKEKTYDHSTRVSQLKMTWIAKTNAEQRAGRAGRCRKGYCFRLFTTEDYSKMNPTQLPEMKRSAIHEVCLHAKMFAPGKTSVRQFLLSAPEPPSPMAIDRSLDFLEQIGALFKNRYESSQRSNSVENSYFGNIREREIEPDLTDLGRHIAQLPLDPQLARFLLFGICLKCLSPVLTLVAALSHRDPFVLPPSGEREERNAAMTARDTFAGSYFSDHMTFLRAVNAFAKLPMHSQSNFCKMNYLSLSAMRMIIGIRQQLFIELQKLRLLPSSCRTPDDHNLNRYCNSWPMIQAAIVAGSYPGIGFTRPGGQMRKIRTSNEVASLPYGCAVKRQVSAGICNVGDGKTGRREPVIEYLAFQELSRTGDTLSLRTVTAVPPLTVLLFAGPVRLKREILYDYSIGDEFALNDDTDTDSNTDECVFELEPWLVFRWKFEDMQLMLKLRVKLMTYFLSMMKQPDCQETEEIKELLATINQILSEDYRRKGFIECTDLPRPRPRSPIVNNEEISERSNRHRQMADLIENQNEQETVDNSYFTVRNYKLRQCNETPDVDSRADFCGGPGILSIDADDVLQNGCNSGHPAKENGTTNNDSNKPVTSVTLPLLVPEEEQVPEDPCTSTVEEGDVKKSEQVSLTVLEERYAREADGENDAPPDRNNEQQAGRWDDRETADMRNAYGPGSRRSYFVPYHLRPGRQRTRRIFSRQFVNRSRPQAQRPLDAVEGEQMQEQHNNEVGRRRDKSHKDMNHPTPQVFHHERWRRNSPVQRFAASGAHRMPRAYFRGGGRGRSDRYYDGPQRGRRVPRKEDTTS